MIGERHAHQVGQRATEVDAAVRPESERRPGRHRLAGVREARSAHGAGTAADLEWHDHQVADLDAASEITAVDHLAHHFVAHREWSGHGIETHGDRAVEVAAGDRHRAHEHVAVVCQLRVRSLSPLEFARAGEEQVLHGTGLSRSARLLYR